MLTSLSIRNVVLIEKLDLSFEKGLCIFTGETGAGKSILLDALSLVLGARSDTGLIRHGTGQLSVRATFTLSTHHPVHEILKTYDIPESSELILARSVSADSKSKAFINDVPVSVNLLRQVGDTLVEIHGQFASHRLLNPATHLDVLDNYGHLDKDKKACQKAFNLYKKATQDVKDAVDILQKAQQEEDYITHAVAELETLDPQIGEEESLAGRRTELMNAEKITESLNTAYMLLSSESGSTVQSILTNAIRELEKASRFTDGKFDTLIEQVDKTSEELSQAVNELESAAAEFDDPAPELERVEERYFTLKDIARKYRVETDELPTLLTDFQTKLRTLNQGQNELENLRQKQQEARLSFLNIAQELSKKRHTAAQELSAAVQQELPPLKLDKARFQIDVADLDEDKASAQGINTVTFGISTNTGVPIAPLHKVASGGELTRLMLALKVNLAQVEKIPTLVFDEADAGVGGATASAVGERLAQLGKECQVLVVTHSPQVAAFGNSHMTVSKSPDEKGCVQTYVIPLGKKERLEEIARMLSGAQITDHARLAAQTLLEKSCL